MHESKRRSWLRLDAHLVAPLGPLVPFGLIASILASGTLFAGTPSPSVKGKVVGWEKLLPQVYAEAAAPDSHRSTWREASPTVKQEFHKLSASVSRDVCIVAFGSGTAQAHEPLSVKVTGGRLTPSTIVLSPGSRLSFKNVDPFSHVLFEAGNDKWAANPMGPGATREWAATTPGLHQIRDQLFPSIVMNVLVDPAAVDFALPDRDGAFSLPVPTTGDYTIKAFFDGKQVGKAIEAVRVSERGTELKEPLSVGGDAK